MIRSRPRDWIPWLAAVLAVVLFTGLGAWQLERAADKRAVIAALESGEGAPARALPGAGRLQEWAWRRVRLRGHFLERQFLLDNRLLAGRPGFDVLTPLVLPDGRAVLVDRGWVAAGPGRRPRGPIASPAGATVTVEGRIWLPERGIALGPALAPAGEAEWPRLTTRVEFPALEAALGRELVPAVIRARGDASWLFRPRPLRPAFGPMRHYGYAFQWFALALTVVIVGIILRRRRRRE